MVESTTQSTTLGVQLDTNPESINKDCFELEQTTDKTMRLYKLLTIHERFVTIDDTDTLLFRKEGLCIPAESHVKTIIHRATQGNATTHIKNEVIAKLKDINRQSLSNFDEDKDRIYAKNGYITVSKSTKNNIHFTPYNDKTDTHYITKKFNVTYNPIAKCPKINDFLQKIVCGKQDRCDALIDFCTQTITQDFFSDLFTITIGKGGTGRSTLIKIQESLLTLANIANVPLKDFNTKPKFGGVRFYHKYLNVVTEADLTYKIKTDEIKRLTSRESREDEIKFAGWTKYYPYVNLFFALNGEPEFQEYDNSVFRRLNIIYFNYDIEKKETVDTDFANSIINDETEMSGYLNLLLDNLMDMIERKKQGKPPVRKCKDTEDYKQRRQAKNCTIDLWIENIQITEYEQPQTIWLNFQDLYYNYSRFTKEVIGNTNESEKKFSDTLAKHNVKSYTNWSTANTLLERGKRYYTNIIPYRFEDSPKTPVTLENF